MQEELDDVTVMVVGHGGLAHVISKAYERSKAVNSIIVVPGNDLISYHRDKEILCIRDIDETQISEIVKLAKKFKVDLVDVCDKIALSLGLVDKLKEAGIMAFGPSCDASRIEVDKVWAKNFMRKYKIPSSNFDSFSSELLAIEYLRGVYRYDPGKKLYVKASGLSDGKGVIQVENFEQAVAAVKKIKSLGKASEHFLIEEGLSGEEVSIPVVSDGKNFHILKIGHNEKYLKNFDRGQIVKGIGANSPVLTISQDSDMMDDLKESIVKKIIKGLEHEKCPFVGILTIGIMFHQEGGRLVPKVIEINAEWSDPESQVVVPGIKTDYVEIVRACIDGKLDKLKIKEDDKSRVCVVGCSRDFPKDSFSTKSKSKIIFGLKKVMGIKDVELFGSHVNLNNENFYATGGRLFHVVAVGNDLIEAKAKAYSAISMITIEGNNLYYRTDIAWRDVEIAQMMNLGNIQF